MRIGRLFASTAVVLSLFGAAAYRGQADETVTYTYDARGRLVAIASSGTANNGVATAIAYDPAGNRNTYAVTGAATGGSTSPPPTAPNGSPVAQTDYLQVSEWSSGVVNVVANDTDPDGDYPLTVTAISGGSGRAYLASASQIGWTGSAAGTYTVTYTLRDNRGATASGTLQVVSVSDNPCGNQICQ